MSPSSLPTAHAVLVRYPSRIAGRPRVAHRPSPIVCRRRCAPSIVRWSPSCTRRRGRVRSSPLSPLPSPLSPLPSPLSPLPSPLSPLPSPLSPLPSPLSPLPSPSPPLSARKLPAVGSQSPHVCSDSMPTAGSLHVVSATVPSLRLSPLALPHHLTIRPHPALARKGT
ncbi:hypothetical protein V8E53_014077 [Lactarius tabidus]